MAAYGREVVEATLEELGVEFTEQIGTPWASAFCPMHEDSNESFTIHMDDGGWRCYAGCGSSGDLAVLVKEVVGTPVAEARTRLRRAIPISGEHLVGTLTRRLATEAGRVEPDTQDADLSYVKGRVPKYILNRGFTIETLKRWDVGTNEDRDAVVIPVTMDGRTHGLVRRMVGGTPKYLNTAGLVKSDVLFGLDMVPLEERRVVLVEGPLDAMWLDQHDISGVAILGSSLSEGQAEILKRRFFHVVIAFDADKAGWFGSLRAARLLQPAMVSRLELPPDKNDVQECSKVELVAALATTRVLSL